MSSAKPATMMASSTVNNTPNLFMTIRRSTPAAARTGSRRRVSGLRGVPSATASTRSAPAVPGGTSRGEARSSAGLTRPHSTWLLVTSPGRATYMVRRWTRMWLGAGSPSAAATNAGADIAVPDSTVQSGNSIRMWSPRRRL